MAAWAAVVVLSFLGSTGVVGTSLFDRLETGDVVAPGEAIDARTLLQDLDTATVPVLLRVDGADVDSPALAAAVAEVAATVGEVDGVKSVVSPMTTPGWPTSEVSQLLLAEDRSAFLISVDAGNAAGSDTQKRAAQALQEAGERLLAPLADDVAVGGTGLLVDEVIDQMKHDLVVGEGLALPLSLLLMLVVFGGFVAAGLPIVGAISVIGCSLALLLGFSHLMELDVTVVNIVTVLGLALCIDYGLLLVSRFREELHRIAPGTAPTDLTDAQIEDAVASAVGNAGRTVTFSAVIVGVSLSGLMIFDAPLVRAIGAAGLAVVAASLAVALTLVPALCAFGGRRLSRAGGTEKAPDDGVFSRLAAWVQRRPALTTVVSVGLLIVLALPALGLRITASGTELLPSDSAQRIFFEDLQDDFPALASASVTVVAQTDLEEAAVWADTWAELPGVTRVRAPRIVTTTPAQLAAVGRAIPEGYDLEGAPVVRIDIFTEGGLTDDAARETVQAVRDSHPPFTTWTTGQAASLTDFVAAVAERAPWAVAWIVLATFVLLFLMTGSLVIPVKALLLNVVSLGASLGVLVWIFQEGHLEGLLRFESVGAIESVIPLMVLAFGFGLSMDYEVFLLARILELHEQGYDDDTAVRLGLQRSGRIITSAGLIMVIVFAGFAAGEMLVIKQTGIALSVAVLLDATLVRMVIVPATMTMLGRWNWWAPGWLRRVHARFGIREGDHAGPPQMTVARENAAHP